MHTTISPEEFLKGPYISNPDATITIGGVPVLIQEILDGNIKPVHTSLIGNLEYRRLTQADITVLLISVLNSEKNNDSDKLLSDRLITRLRQDIPYGTEDDLLSAIIYTSSDSGITLNMEMYNSEGYPKPEVIGQIFSILNPVQKIEKRKAA